jgi:putative DNA primase/helicase
MAADYEQGPPPGRFDDDEPSGAVAVDIKTRKRRTLPEPSAGQHVFDLGDHVEIGKWLDSDVQSVGHSTFADGAFYRYDAVRGVYSTLTEQSLRCLVQGYSGSPVSDGNKRLKLKLTDIKSGIICAADRIADPDFFQSSKRGTAFLSTFVEVTAEGIIQHEHKQEHRARFAYDFAYKPDAEPAELLAFLRASFRDDSDAEEKIQLLQEHVGMSLIGEGCRFQKVIMMTGNEGSNGKSTFQSMIAEAMPPGSTISVSPHDMHDDYSRAQFPGRLLNVVSEVEAKELASAEPFKAIIDGKNLIKARAIFKDVIFFRPIAGHLYSCNILPDTTDQSGGFWRRWEVVGFNRTFAPHEQDTNIEAKVAKERPALVSWLLRGAQRALERDRYEPPPSSAQALTAWRKRADQVDAFVDERCEKLGVLDALHNWTPSEQLYKVYRLWAADMGHRIPLTAGRFKERMALLKLAAKRTEDHVCFPVRLKH